MVLRQSKRPLTFPPRPLGDMFCKSEGLIQSGAHILSYCDDSCYEVMPANSDRPGTGTYFTDFRVYRDLCPRNEPRTAVRFTFLSTAIVGYELDRGLLNANFSGEAHRQG